MWWLIEKRFANHFSHSNWLVGKPRTNYFFIRYTKDPLSTQIRSRRKSLILINVWKATPTSKIAKWLWLCRKVLFQFSLKKMIVNFILGWHFLELELVALVKTHLWSFCQLKKLIVFYLQHGDDDQITNYLCLLQIKD